MERPRQSVICGIEAAILLTGYAVMEILKAEGVTTGAAKMENHGIRAHHSTFSVLMAVLYAEYHMHRVTCILRHRRS